MLIYRTHLHGHRVEARFSDMGRETVLVDGREIASRWLYRMLGRTHHFDLTDEQGGLRHVELRLIQADSLGLKYTLKVAVDGVERAALAPVNDRAKPGRCINCGYELKGLEPHNHEVLCPECGRHTPVIELS